jgi:hypothetical protein
MNRSSPDDLSTQHSFAPTSLGRPQTFTRCRMQVENSQLPWLHASDSTCRLQTIR